MVVITTFLPDTIKIIFTTLLKEKKKKTFESITGKGENVPVFSALLKT